MIVGSMLILTMTVTGQHPGNARLANPQAVVSKPGEPVKQWLDGASPIDGRHVKILGWMDQGYLRYWPDDNPHLKPKLPETPVPSPVMVARPSNPVEAPSVAGKPTGVVLSQFPMIQAGHGWNGGNMERPVVTGQSPASSPDVYLTIIGPERKRIGVKQSLERSPNFAALAREMGPRLAVEAYAATNPLVADVGLVAGGDPDIVVLDRKGHEHGRFKADPGPDILAEAVRKADPTYRPGGGRVEEGKIGIAWIAAALVAAFFIMRARQVTPV